MKQSIQKLSRGKRATMAVRRGALTLTIAAFAPVRFAVSVQHMPVFCSAWRFSSGKAPVPADFAGHTLIPTGHNPAFCSHEDPCATPAATTPATYSRPYAPAGEGPRGEAVSRRVPRAVVDRTGVAVGGAGLGAQTRKRRFLNGGASRFTEPRIGSQPMVEDGGPS